MLSFLVGKKKECLVWFAPNILFSPSNRCGSCQFRETDFYGGRSWGGVHCGPRASELHGSQRGVLRSGRDRTGTSQHDGGDLTVLWEIYAPYTYTVTNSLFVFVGCQDLQQHAVGYWNDWYFRDNEPGNQVGFTSELFPDPWTKCTAGDVALSPSTPYNGTTD